MCGGWLPSIPITISAELPKRVCAMGGRLESIQHRVKDALSLTCEYLLSNQRVDGTWAGLVESDPRTTAFYLNSHSYIGRCSDDRTREMERYLRTEQLACGAWQAWPGGEPDLDVTATCALALENSNSELGKVAAKAAQKWLVSQPFPAADLFWKGYLALNGELNWTHTPYFTPRLVSNRPWLPNVYDFSFVRTAIVSLGLIQQHMKQHAEVRRPERSHRDSGNCRAEQQQYIEWKCRWASEASKPIRGVLPILSGISMVLDHWVPIAKHRQAAIVWLLERQESDGSFFSSLHMTSLAILTLHTLDKGAYRDRIEAGLEAMQRWQVIDSRGCWQQFTDSTNWDTGLCMDLLRRLGVPPTHEKIQRARDYLVASQNRHAGDWSYRARGVAPGGWSFQRTGKWYPDVDDTAMIATALLDLEDGISFHAARRGLVWILGMQNCDGGWASWDRDDRSWIQSLGAGPWLARDLACADITARVITLLSRVISGKYRGLDDLLPRATAAVRHGLEWLRRDREGSAWFGAWFSHYLYGTSHAVEALRESGYGPGDHDIRAARDWIISIANFDGGYGEMPNSGRRNGFTPGPSTPFHTACALNTLVQAGASDHQAATCAVQWLLGNQNADGTWTSEAFFAAGVPGLWYAKFHLTQTCIAARSLLAFTEANSQP